MSEKPHSIQLMRLFNFSQSGSRKNNRKAFERTSMEPTNMIMKLQKEITVKCCGHTTEIMVNIKD